MNISDWVLVGTSLFLGVTALFVPYLAEFVKRKAFAPKLTIQFDLTSHYCWRTSWTRQGDPNYNEPVYFFHFQITNDGKSQARFCEISLEDLWIYDASGSPIKYEHFTPVSLITEALNINPHRKMLIQIGHISSPAFQADDEERRMFIDIPGSDAKGLRFLLDQKQHPKQPNCFLPGKYAIKVSIYSENAPREEAYFEIAWSGKWQDTEADMFRELVIHSIPRP